MLAAGLDGVRRGLKPPAPVNRNIYHMTEEESRAAGIRGLPHNLEDALTALEADPVVCAGLGEHILGAFISEKRSEWAEYREQVHGWEIERYLDRY